MKCLEVQGHVLFWAGPIHMGTPPLQLWENFFYYFFGDLLPTVFSDLLSEAPISKSLDRFTYILIFPRLFSTFPNFILQFFSLNILFTSYI